MQKKHVRAIALIACSLPLGACSSLFGIHFARSAPKAEAVASRGGDTDAGRRQLAEGQIGLAIESFQKALAAGEPTAPAANGLGVAFARLGRFELALGYFQRAMAADPTDARYAANIGRLTRSAAMQMRHDQDLAAAAQKASEAQAGRLAAVQPATARVDRGKLERVSRGEVRIATVAPQTAPARSAGLPVDRRFRPLVRVTFAKPAGVQPQPFVRVALPETKPALVATSVAAAASKAGESR